MTVFHSTRQLSLSILVVCEPVIARTTLGWRRPGRSGKERRETVPALSDRTPFDETDSD